MLCRTAMLSSLDLMSNMEHMLTDKKTRYYILDAYRGLCVILMILHHIAFDLVIYEYIPEWLIFNPILDILQPFFAGSFILLSGISCRFSRNNLKKGIILAFIAAGVSLVTYFFTPDMYISFGILHFLACASILYSIFNKLFFNDTVFLIIWSAIFAVAFHYFPIMIEKEGYAFLGFPTPFYASGDYYPILPWIFLFFAGSCIGGFIKKNKMPAFFYTVRIPFLEKIGKYSLIIYLAHQPLIYGIMLLLEKYGN